MEGGKHQREGGKERRERVEWKRGCEKAPNSLE
jgi:hypothetical protein